MGQMPQSQKRKFFVIKKHKNRYQNSINRYFVALNVKLRITEPFFHYICQVFSLNKGVKQLTTISDKNQLVCDL